MFDITRQALTKTVLLPTQLCADTEWDCDGRCWCHIKSFMKHLRTDYSVFFAQRGCVWLITPPKLNLAAFFIYSLDSCGGCFDALVQFFGIWDLSSWHFSLRWSLFEISPLVFVQAQMAANRPRWASRLFGEATFNTHHQHSSNILNI